MLSVEITIKINLFWLNHIVFFFEWTNEKILQWALMIVLINTHNKQPKLGAAK